MTPSRRRPARWCLAALFALVACNSGDTEPLSRTSAVAVPAGTEPPATGTATTNGTTTTGAATSTTASVAVDSSATSPPASAEPDEVRVPTEADLVPITDLGIAQPIGNAPLPDDYVETEYLFGGEAVSYLATGELTTDGLWAAAEHERAPYRTRMIVRRPPEERFSGTVFVEWMNVTSAADTTPDWGYLHEEIGRRGHAYVAVSVQEIGVNGAEDSPIAGDLIDTRGLKTRDPERYRTLEHPGDAFAYDIFTQAGAAVSGLSGIDVLDGLEPRQVIALGESQSASFMIAYVDAIHHLVELFDGFLVHSRGASARALDGDRSPSTAGVRIRTDVSVPVFTFQTETDIVGLGFEAARQPDREMIHTWEVAGTAHADAYALSAATGLPREATLGELIGCSTPINDGPQHEILQAALRHLVAWVSDGTTPPPSPRLRVEGPPEERRIARDDLGIALGGIRTPPVDVPLRVLSGEPGLDNAGFCFLFGETMPLADGSLEGLYPSTADFLDLLESSAAEAVRQGWLLPEDATTMIAEETERAAALGVG